MTALDKRVITVTEIGVFKRCRLMWSYMYKDRIAPIKEQPYFFHGRMTHRTLEEWTTAPDSDLEEQWATITSEEIGFFTERYIKNIGVRPANIEIEAMLSDAMMPYEMVKNYRKHWRTPLPDDFELLQAEQTCIVEIPNPFNLECLNNTFLEGTLDGLVINRKNGKLYILERKTYEKRPNIATLDYNEQFTLYAWIVSKLFPQYEIGGTLYDGLWKREAPPKGRKFEDLFFRHTIEKTAAELVIAENNLVRVATDMLNLTPEIYPNRVWQGCYDDKSYIKLCSAQMKGEDTAFLLDSEYGERAMNKWMTDLNDE